MPSLTLIVPVLHTISCDIEPSVVHFIELRRVSLPLQHRFVYCVLLPIGSEMAATYLHRHSISEKFTF
jgi:hypothetical protein